MKPMLVLVLAGVALAGCSGVGSVHPIYTQDDTVALSGVIGTWTMQDKEDKLVISSGENGGFTLRFWDEHGILNNFDVHLTKIGGALFGDLYATNNTKDAPLSMPVHLFARVEVNDGKIKLYPPDAKWFDAQFEKRPNAAHHVKQYAKGEQGWIYLSDSTKQVRAFIKKCAKHPEAFAGDMVLTKVSDSQDLPAAPPTADAENKEGQAPGK